MPRSVRVVRVRITVINVIGVFPYVHGHQRRGAGGQRGTRIRSGNDSQFAISLFYQPVQPEPKFLTAASVNFALKSAKLPNAALIAAASSPSGSPPAFGAAVPVEGVVPHLCGVVEYAAV